MAEAGDREPAEKIQVTVAVSVIEIRAFAAGERERQASVDIDHVGVGEFDYFGAVHFPMLRLTVVTEFEAEHLSS